MPTLLTRLAWSVLSGTRRKKKEKRKRERETINKKIDESTNKKRSERVCVAV
jgi:hypothetical protein